MVEIEYLLWTFADDAQDGVRWLHASRNQRARHFTPGAMRNRSGGRFRSSEYRSHCEIGGHPTPRGWHLLGDTFARTSWVDLGQHLESTWGLLVTACGVADWAAAAEHRADAVEQARAEWHERDVLAKRPPVPPDDDGDWKPGPHLTG